MRFDTLLPQAVGAVGKWESRFWISTFPRPSVKNSVGFDGDRETVGAVGMWESRGVRDSHISTALRRALG